MLNQPNNQPNQNPNNQPNNPQPGFTMQQKFILLSLTLVMVTVATVFLAVLQFYQPKIEPMVIVVTATPELMPTADLGQGQVSDQQAASEATRTPTVTSVFSPEEEATINSFRTPGAVETANAVNREQVRASGGLTATVLFEFELQATQRALTPTATDWPELATAKAEKQGTPLSIDEQAALNRVYYGGKRERGQVKANELGQCVLDEDGVTYYCPGSLICYQLCVDYDPLQYVGKDKDLDVCFEGKGTYLSCGDEKTGRYFSSPFPDK